MCRVFFIQMIMPYLYGRNNQQGLHNRYLEGAFNTQFRLPDLRQRFEDHRRSFDRLLCGCQAHYIRGLFFSYDSFTSRPKRDLLLCVARHRAVTLTRNAPLSKAQSPGISVSRIEPYRAFPLPVLPVVESFTGAMSPLGSKEPNEPFL